MTDLLMWFVGIMLLFFGGVMILTSSLFWAMVAVIVGCVLVYCASARF